jgi:hypothetical protein
VRGVVLCKRSDLAAGVSDLEAAIRADSTAYLAMMRCAEAYEAMKNRGRALQLWASITRESKQIPTPPSWMQLAAATAQARLA